LFKSLINLTKKEHEFIIVYL